MCSLDTIRQATFVQFETTLVEYNKGQSCHFQVDGLLRSMGFYLYTMDNLMRNTELFKTWGTGYLDMLYVNPTSPRLPQEFRDLHPHYCGSRSSSRQEERHRPMAT
jgi:hypothetical protein